MALPANELEQKDSRPEFLIWLRAEVERAGISASRLQQMLVRRGYDCTAESVRRWLRGERVPGAEVIPYVLAVLSEVLPKDEVHASFKRFAQMS